MWLLHLWYSLKNRKRILLPFSLSINTLFKWHLVYKRNQRRINNTPPPKKKLGGDMFLYSSGMFRTTGCLLYMYINLYSHSVVINSMRVFIYHLNSILMQELIQLLTCHAASQQFYLHIHDIVAVLQTLFSKTKTLLDTLFLPGETFGNVLDSCIHFIILTFKAG